MLIKTTVVFLIYKKSVSLKTHIIKTIPLWTFKKEEERKEEKGGLDLLLALC